MCIVRKRVAAPSLKKNFLGHYVVNAFLVKEDRGSYVNESIENGVKINAMIINSRIVDLV